MLVSYRTLALAFGAMHVQLPYGPYPIAIAAGCRPSKESSLRAVVPPEARTPPPRVAELARVRVARVAAVDRGAVLRDRGAGAQDRGKDRKRRAVDGQDAHVDHRPQVVEGAPALVDDDLAVVAELFLAASRIW